MPKPTKSQWDFGELFPTEATRAVLTVAELTAQVKRLLEKQVGQIWVTGEITNLRAQSSGHIYFTLKDAESQLICVLFRNEARESREFLQDGRKVVLQGDVTVYEPRGQYQLRVTAVELQGVGALQMAFEKLKQKLNAEGLFAAERKRPLPRFPQRIGIVTSPTGAAIRDVLHVVQRRNPALEIVLAPCRVQGQGAAEEIAAAIKMLNEFNSAFNTSQSFHEKSGGPAVSFPMDRILTSPLPSPLPGEGSGEGDVSTVQGVKARNSFRRILPPIGGEGRGALDLILVTRGGGSLEDLWAFNEEAVARAIFESKLPVISAVGHEIDFTISDFVADARAATPSAAAEIITEDVFSSRQFLFEAGGLMRQLLQNRLEDKMSELAQIRHRLVRLHPRRRLNEWLQRLDDLRGGLSRCARMETRNRQVAWRHLQERLLRLRPRQILAQRQELLRLEILRLGELGGRHLENKRSRLANLQARLRLLGPEQVLARGYSITMRADNGKIIRTAGEVNSGQKLRTRLKSGELRSTVESEPGSSKPNG
jgi:exodeoxyribonuclease VII large subunit